MATPPPHTHCQTTPIVLVSHDGVERQLVLANDLSGIEGRCELRILDAAGNLLDRAVKCYIDIGGHIGAEVPQGNPEVFSLA